MDTEEARAELILGRSSSRGSQADSLSRSDSLQGAEVRRKGKKSYSYGNDLFVCFAPRPSLHLVSRPVHSPSRNGRSRTAHHSFSRFHKGSKKHGYEASPDPTSPVVTCVGQVRVKQKPTKAGSSSSFLSLASKRLKWVPFFGSYKACSKVSTDISCLFRLPCDSHGSIPSGSSNKGRNCCKSIFARSLLLIQDDKKTGDSSAKDGSCREYLDLLSEPIVKEVEKLKMEDEENEKAACSKTVEELQPPTNALLLTRCKLEPVLAGALKRSTSAPSQHRIECVGRSENENGLDKERESGLSESEPQSSRSLLNRSKSEGKTRCFVEDDSSKMLTLLTSVHQLKLDSKFEEEKKQEDATLKCLSPQEEPSKKQNLENEKEGLGPSPPSLDATSVACTLEALKVSVDMVPETWIWQRCNNLDPSENTKYCPILAGELQGSRESLVKDNPVIEDGYGRFEWKDAACMEAQMINQKQQQANSDNEKQALESQEQNERQDAYIQQDMGDGSNISQEEEELLWPDWKKYKAVETLPPEGTVLLLSYKVDALRLSVDAALEMLSNGEEASHKTSNVEQEPLSSIYTRVMKEGKGYSIFKCKSKQTKAFQPPYSFQLQRCKSEPVRLAV